jgi:hypothetical protein
MVVCARTPRTPIVAVLSALSLQQTTVDVGTRGPGPGDQLIFSGDIFDHAGGTKLGTTAGPQSDSAGRATRRERCSPRDNRLTANKLSRTV